MNLNANIKTGNLLYVIGNIANNATADVSIDQYHHYKVFCFFFFFTFAREKKNSHFLINSIASIQSN